MIVMAAANSNIVLGYLAGKYPGRIGAMVSPATRWMKPHDFLPYAIDNGMYADTMANREWDEKKFLGLLDKAKRDGVEPEFIVVPDSLYNRDETLRKFDVWAPRLESWGYRLAIACQDGMTPADVPEGVVAFIGGTDQFKRQVYSFVENCDYTHVGRVSGFKRLAACHRLGVDSVDGSGWFRRGGIERVGGRQRIDPLLRYLENAEKRDPQSLLWD